jgi:hypothetical protein
MVEEYDPRAGAVIARWQLPRVRRGGMSVSGAGAWQKVVVEKECAMIHSQDEYILIHDRYYSLLTHTRSAVTCVVTTIPT